MVFLLLFGGSSASTFELVDLIPVAASSVQVVDAAALIDAGAGNVIKIESR